MSLTLLLPFTGNAQSGSITLQDALKLALTNNQSIAISRYEEQIGEQQIIQARSRALPQVNLNGNFTDNYKRQVLVLPAGTFGGSASDKPSTIVAGTLYSTSLGVDASQALIDPAVFTALKAAQGSSDYYKLNTKQTEEDVIRQTAQAYYGILASREQIVVQDSNISRLNRIITATEGQYKAGLARKIDLDRIRVSLTNAQTLRLQQLNQVSARTNELKMLMGVAIETDITPADISLREIETRAATYIPAESFDLNSRTEIRVLDEQINLAGLQAKSIRAENYPKLSAFVNYSGNAVSNGFSDLFTSGGQDVGYGMGSFGLRLNVPVFDGFARQSRTRQATIQGLELRKRREATALSLAAGFSNARYQMASNVSAIAAQKQNVQLAESVYNASQTNYNLGLASLTDLLDAQNSFIQAQNSFTQALLDYKIAELETIRATGNLRSLLQ